ncbi:MAG: hypothetical protein ACFCD0_11880 [Gemmataceae bacterium]
MPIHVGQMQSDVTVLDANMPLSEAQIEKLVTLVLQRLEEQQRAQQAGQAETSIRNESTHSSSMEL